jgi:integrase
MPKENLTQSFVDKLLPDSDKSKCDYFDTKQSGFLLKILSSGRKSYYIRYRNQRGKQVEVKIADDNVTKLNDARELAIKYLAQIAMGEDPFSIKADLKKVPTVYDFITNSYLPFVKTYKRSWETDVSLIKNHIMPNFGKQYMDEVSKRDVIQFISRHTLTHKPGSVNRVIIMLRYIFNLSIRWETAGITKNPTAGIPLLEENNKKERYLTGDEANKLIVALQTSQNKMLQYIVPMLILTGARKQEVLKAKWEDFNLDQKVWRIPTSKSGKARHVPISDGVLYLLSGVPRQEDCDSVFANPKTLLPYVSIFASWNTARTSVGLSDVRMHDLRHSFASFLVNSGRSIYEVQRILGHTQIKTTQRYAHLSQDSLLAAANEISKAVPILMAMPNRVVDVPLLQVA